MSWASRFASLSHFASLLYSGQASTRSKAERYRPQWFYRHPERTHAFWMRSRPTRRHRRNLHRNGWRVRRFEWWPDASVIIWCDEEGCTLHVSRARTDEDRFNEEARRQFWEGDSFS